jgi:hypothetical protein
MIQGKESWIWNLIFLILLITVDAEVKFEERVSKRGKSRWKLGSISSNRNSSNPVPTKNQFSEQKEAKLGKFFGKTRELGKLTEWLCGRGSQSADFCPCVPSFHIRLPVTLRNTV